MGLIDFENISSLPDIYLKKMTELSDIFKQIEHIEEVEPEIYELIYDIDQYCKKGLVVGYHFTRASAESITNRGLLIRNGNEIRQHFLDEYGHVFSPEETIRIKNLWENYFTIPDCEGRDGKVFFNFTLNALKNRGAYYLLNYFGGEQIHFPLTELGIISSKIASLGEPLIVRCRLKPENIYVPMHEPWGKIAVSAFHRAINEAAMIVDQDGYQVIPVGPDDLEVIKYEC